MFTIYNPCGIIFHVRNKDGPLYILWNSKTSFNFLKVLMHERLRRKEEYKNGYN